MRRIILNLDPMKHFCKSMNKEKDFTHYFCLSELEEINGVSLTFVKSLFTTADIQLLNQIKKTFLQVKAAANDIPILINEKTPPDMVTIIHRYHEISLSSEGFSSLDSLDDFNQVIHELKEKSVLSGLLIKANINLIKRCAGLSADYLEFDLADIADIKSYSEELQYFENLKICLLAADKLGFGISCSNIPNYDYLHYLKGFSQIEEFVIGNEIFNRVLHKGLEKSIHHFVQLIKY